MYDFAFLPRSALIQILALTPIVYQTARFQLVAAGVQPCRTLRLMAIMPSWPPNWLFVWGIPDQLGLTAADHAKKLQFQMNVFWLKAAKVVPKGGPRHDT
jgi:hypothetical protein